MGELVEEATAEVAAAEVVTGAAWAAGAAMDRTDAAMVAASTRATCRIWGISFNAFEERPVGLAVKVCPTVRW
ncbi:hypothetical protein GCM10009725_02950 [Aeromicrobium tamlense]